MTQQQRSFKDCCMGGVLPGYGNKMDATKMRNTTMLFWVNTLMVSDWPMPFVAPCSQGDDSMFEKKQAGDTNQDLENTTTVNHAHKRGVNRERRKRQEGSTMCATNRKRTTVAPRSRSCSSVTEERKAQSQCCGKHVCVWNVCLNTTVFPDFQRNHLQSWRTAVAFAYTRKLIHAQIALSPGVMSPYPTVVMVVKAQ